MPNSLSDSLMQQLSIVEIAHIEIALLDDKSTI